jgi:hypothetical protein
VDGKPLVLALIVPEPLKLAVLVVSLVVVAGGSLKPIWSSMASGICMSIVELPAAVACATVAVPS